MALVASGEGSSAAHTSALLFYLVAYAFMTLGAFAVISVLCRQGGERSELDFLRGLSNSHPWLAAALSLCLLSLAGIPPTVGFVGKFYLFVAAIHAGYLWLALFGAMGAAVGVYYYLRPIVLMYMQGEEEGPRLQVGRATGLLLVAVSVLILGFGLFPKILAPFCHVALASLVG